MASKMAALQTLLVLLWVCVAGVTACPSECRCEQGNLYVDCAGALLTTIPTGLPSWTKALNMANNRLTAIDANALAGLNLHEIDLRYNNIQEVQTEALRLDGDCSLDDFEYIKNTHVKFARWNLLDFTQTTWPCAIDLRKNPISRVKPRAFAGSHNFTVLLGQSSTVLTIETPAFGDTQHVIGIHITDVPKLNFFVGSMDGIIDVGWIVLDKTEISFQDQIFSSATNTRPRWFRISNTNIRELESDILRLNMDVSAKCDVITHPYRPASVLTSHISTVSKGGVEFINNTMPELPTGLFRSSNIGGMYFHGNRIPGFQPGVFARDVNDVDICIILFFNNDFKTLPAGLFEDLNVHHLIISENKLPSIQANTFAGSNSIGHLRFRPDENQANKELVFKANAFSGMNNVKIVNIIAVENKLPKVVIEPFAFDGLNVDYLTMFLYDSMPMLPYDVFIGLTVNQNFVLSATNINQITPTSFGRENTSVTSINRLEVRGEHSFPCDCDAVFLSRFLKKTVKGEVVGFTCTATLDDGTVSHTQPLDSYNMTCTPPITPTIPTKTNAASGLQGHILIFIILITVLFNPRADAGI